MISSVFCLLIRARRVYPDPVGFGSGSGSKKIKLTGSGSGSGLKNVDPTGSTLDETNELTTYGSIGNIAHRGGARIFI